MSGIDWSKVEKAADITEEELTRLGSALVVVVTQDSKMNDKTPCCLEID